MMYQFLRRLFSAVCLHLIVVMVRSDASGPDGSNGTDGDSCSCCAATITEMNPWMKVDLGRQYRLGSIEVFARTEKEQDLAGMNMFIHIQPDNWENNYEEKMTIPDIDDARYYKFTIDNPVVGRYVTLQMKGWKILVVCEINIYSQDCAAGSYGPLCADTCGHCQEGEICDHVNGSCRRCAAGYLGDHCNTDCSAGTYGASCSETCGHCQTGETCDHVTGACTRCEPGYRGPTCRDTCTEGTFGQDCISPCRCLNDQTCNHVTGTCLDDQCDLGWHGSNCSHACEPGTYGQNCLQNCGNCFGNEACDRRTGECRLCSSGYTGLPCKEECSPGTFGQNCSSTCGNCMEPCDVVTGVCSTVCLPGYTGTYCNETCNEGFYGNNCSLKCGECATNVTCNYTNGWCENGCEEGYVGQLCSKAFQNSAQSGQSSDSTIGIAAGCSVAVICAVVVLVVVFILRRRRDTIYEDPKWNAQETQNRVYAELDGNSIQQESNSDTLGTETDADIDIDIGQEAPSRRDADYVNTNQRDTIYEDLKWNAQETQNRVYAELDGKFKQQGSNSDTLGTETDADIGIDIGQEAPSRRDADYVNTNQRSK